MPVDDETVSMDDGDEPVSIPKEESPEVVIVAEITHPFSSPEVEMLVIVIVLVGEYPFSLEKLKVEDTVRLLSEANSLSTPLTTSEERLNVSCCEKPLSRPELERLEAVNVEVRVKAFSVAFEIIAKITFMLEEVKAFSMPRLTMLERPSEPERLNGRSIMYGLTIMERVNC